MSAAAILVPGPLDALTGGSIYDRRVVDGLRARGWAVDVRELDSSFPEPTARALAEAAAVLATIPDQGVVVIDGLASGAMPDLLEVHATRLKFIALVHMPLAAEFGLDADAARRRRADECRALRCVRAIVGTGRMTLDALARMGPQASEVVLIEPGCDPAPLARGADHPIPHLLCVAAVIPGKGHDGLLRALSSVDAEWTLTCVGSQTRDPATAHRATRLTLDLSIGDRVSFEGELRGDSLARAYDRADVFVLSTLRETYGMAVSEAIAHGLPVVSTRTGAIPQLVGDEAGLLVDPGDQESLRVALTQMLTDDATRTRCRDGAIRARAHLRSWHVVVDQMAHLIDRVSTRG